jgi:hypothetical protein
MTGEEFDSAITKAASGDAALRATKIAPPDDASAEALRSYTGGGYREINGTLRSSKGEVPESASYFTQRDIAGVDAALAVRTSSRAIAVTRGVTDHRALFDGQEPRAGMTWVDHGFVSTSVGDPGSAFANGDAPMRMRILVPRGTRSASAGPRQRRDILDPDEVLLDRGLTYRVVRDNGMDAEGIRRVDVEVVP